MGTGACGRTRAHFVVEGPSVAEAVLRALRASKYTRLDGTCRTLLPREAFRLHLRHVSEGAKGGHTRWPHGTSDLHVQDQIPTFK